MSALLHAVRCGDARDVKMYIKQGVDVNYLQSDDCNALHIAANDGLTQIGKLLIDAKIDIDAVDTYGYCALHFAVANDHTKFGSLLIESDSDLNLQDSNGMTALHHAVKKELNDFVELLIGGGIDVNVQNLDGQSALHLSLSNKKLKIAFSLIKGGIDLDLKEKDGFSTLHAATFVRNTSMVHLLIESGSSINSQNEDGSTALHTAVIEGHIKIFHLLIDSGIDLNIKDKGGLTALHTATIKGNAKFLCVLIDSGSKLNVQDKIGKSALHYAISNKMTDICKLLIDGGIDINLQDEIGKSALHHATSNKMTDMCKLLIDGGIDINLQDEDFKSALHYNILYWKPEIFKILIDGGIDLHLQDKDGLTALHASIAEGNTKIVQLVIRKSTNINLQDTNGRSALHYATEHTKTEIAKLLIDSGIDLKLQDEDGWTALHAATEKGNTKLIRYLIGNGRGRNVQDKDGRSALHHAVLTSKTELVQLLAVGGIDVNLQDQNGFTALHLATQERNTAAIHILLDNAIDTNLQEKNGWTALHSGAWIGVEEIAQLIIEKGININIKAKDDSTALHLAAHNGKQKIVDLLICYGIVVNSQDKNGNSALHHAALKGHTQIVRSLISSSIDVNLQNKDGWTALHFGVEYNEAAVVYLLIDCGDILNIQANNGDTALHMAARNSRLKLVTYFVKRHCDPSLRNDERKKPIDVTRDEKIKAVLKDYDKTVLPGLPFEVKNLDEKSAKVFSRILEEESYPHFESRVMLAGEQGTGKTTIARYLIGKRPTRTRKSTDGIELYNGLSYMDCEKNVWLSGQQNFSLEEIVIGRSLLKEDKKGKSLKLQDSEPIRQDVLHMRSDDISKQKIKTEYNKDTLQTGLRDRTYSSESRPRSLVSDKKRAHDIVQDYQTGKDGTDSLNHRSIFEGPSNREEAMDRPTDADSQSGLTDKRHIQTVTKPGFIKSLKNFFGVTKKVEEVKVSITKKALLQKSSEVGKKHLDRKKIAPIIIWDFGGQDVFYSTHQTFLTYRAIYMIVLDGSRNLDDPCPYEQYLPGKTGHKTARDYLLFWINTIVTYCKGSMNGFPKIMIVLTHKDKVKANEVDNKRYRFFAEISKIFEQTPIMQHLVIKDRLFVNAKDKYDQEMEMIKSVIIRESVKQPTWGESLPKCFIALELELASLITRNTPLITIKDLQKINALAPIRPLSGMELKVFLKFQHSIGKILFFDEHKLDKHVILSPTFLIDAFKSIVTDRRFCEGDKEREQLWDTMGKQGVVPKKDIQIIWKKKEYRVFYDNKDYLLDAMTHLDILVEPKRYDSDHKCIPADFYYVASMVQAKDDSRYLQSPDFSHRSIALAFQSSSMMIPPALSFRFLSYCLCVWAVKTYGQTNKNMLFHRSGVFTIDPSLDMCITCDDEIIVARLVHARTNALIMRDLASSINECLTSALEKISQLYIRTSSAHIQSCNASFLASICCNSPDNPCIFKEPEKKSKTWICPSHGIEHKMHTITAWFPTKDEDQCEPECPVTNEEFLREHPTDLHLRRLSFLYKNNEIRELALQLGFEVADLDNISSTDDPMTWKFEVVRKCRDKFSLTFKHIREAAEKGKIKTIHTLCKIVKGDRIDFDREPEKWDLELTEEHIDILSPLIGDNSLQFLIELEMGFNAWERINCRHTVARDLVKLNKEILEEWKNNFCKIYIQKPTLRKIAQAFSNIGKHTDIVQNTLF